jgi:hypothetical protein
MAMRLNIGRCVIFVLLAVVLIGVWAYWQQVPPQYAWVLEEPNRILAHFAPRQTVKASYRLRNTANVPLRIVGGSAC